ncbi:hypothetical protein ACFOQM_23455 [Paenibacillus sp. GCM10012307]|uniref:Uncharacterized protein n=1 Tax=Paenibacillus roseus TaxID=2798579 RepID=A0A934MRE7_9BACL|nr:hypothetical protein [Paenibacillus roseus]MBJ6364181.1 hypothetical protein [Paenibacillus roseus]
MVQVGDWVRIVGAMSDSKYLYGYENGEEYEVKSVIGVVEPCIWPDGTTDSAIPLSMHEYEIISKEDETLKSLTEQLTEAREKVIKLEAQIKADAIGKIAITTAGGYYEDIDEGVFVRITQWMDEEGVGYPVEAELLDGSDYDTFRPDEIRFIDEDEARRILSEKNEQIIAQAFGDRP